MIKNLKTLRNEHQLSQAQLGKLIGVSQQSVNKYENENAEPDLRILKKMAECLNTSIDYLIGYTDFPYPIKDMINHSLTAEELKIIQKYRSLKKKQQDAIKNIIEEFSE